MIIPTYENPVLYIGYDFNYTLSGAPLALDGLLLSGFFRASLDYPITGGEFLGVNITGSGTNASMSLPAQQTAALKEGNVLYTVNAYTGLSGIIPIFRGYISCYPFYFS